MRNLVHTSKDTLKYQRNFDGSGSIGYCPNQYTIAPRMVLFDLKFDVPLARECTIIILDTITFQRLPIFGDSNNTKQQSVQNWVI